MTKKAREIRMIVVARIEIVQECAGTDGIDLGYRPVMRDVPICKAAVWKSNATDEDLEKAVTFAMSEGYTVLEYPVGERKPLERAKREMLASHRMVERAANPAK